MKIIEESIKLDHAEKIFDIIGETLSNNINTQIFVANAILTELTVNNVEHHVFHPNYSKTFHYQHDEDNFGGEDWYMLTEGRGCDPEIARASFIGNCKGYRQLVQFANSKLEYTHYLVGIEQILFIQLDLTALK